MKHSIIIADLHLSAQTHDLNQLFKQKLQDWSNCADALYILGDLFDAWIGDDNSCPVIADLTQALHDFAQKKPLKIMRGNRDFLLGNSFARKSGACLLPDKTIENFYGKSIILTHGDEQCTDDVQYQKFRRAMRQKWRRNLLLMLPLSVRKKLAAKIRSASEYKKRTSSQYAISDVTPEGVRQLQQWAQQSASGVCDIIHGHTHRCAVHTEFWEGRAYRRYVLEDWRENRGGCLMVLASGEIKSQSFALPL